MSLFKIVDQKGDQLITETHYYKWLLSKKPTDIHSIDTKLDYLKEQGFIRGTDKITLTSYTTLKAIEETYFRRKIEPNLK